MAFKLAEAFVDIVGKTNGIEGTLGGVQARLGKTVDAFANAATKIGSAMTKIGSAITAGSGFALKLGMDAVESENLFEVSFGKMATAARKWSEELSKSVGLNAYEVRKMSGTFYVMLNSMGLSETKAYEMSTAMTKLSYDMASFYNLSPEEAFEKLQAGITGEAEPLKRLGIILLDTQLKQQALKMGLDGNTQSMDEATKVAVRFAAIMDQTSKAQGDLARTMDSPTNQLRMMKAQMTQVGIEIGKTLIPAFQNLLNKVQPLIPAFQKFVAAHGDLIVNVSMLGAAMMVTGPALMAIEPGLKVLSALGVGLKAASGILFGWPGLVAGVVVGGWYLLENWDSIKEWSTQNWPYISRKMEATWNTMKASYPILQDMERNFSNATKHIRQSTEQWASDNEIAMGRIGKAFSEMGQDAKTQLGSIEEWAFAWGEMWFIIWDNAGKAVNWFVDQVLSMMGYLVKAIGGEWTQLWQDLTRDFGLMFKSWGQMIDNMLLKVSNAMRRLRESITGTSWDPFKLPEQSGSGGGGGSKNAKPSASNNIAISVNGASDPQATASAVKRAIVDAQRYGYSAGSYAVMP